MYQTATFKNYTPELRELVEAGFPVFNGWWGTYIPEHKQELIGKIIHTYYFNQICCPEPDRFKYYINAQLERIMPYYNQLYASELIKIDPILNQFLETNNRSIENLLREANKENSVVGEHIRNFAKSATGNIDTVGNVGVNYSEDVQRNGTSETNKNGTRGVDETTTEDGTVKTDRTVDETRTTDGNGNSTTTETGTVNRDGTKSYSDTPQRDLQGNILTNYLTNYTATSDDETRNLQTQNTYTTNEEMTDNVKEAGTVTTDKDGTRKVGETYEEDVNGKTTDTETTTRKNSEDSTGNQKSNTFESGKDDALNKNTGIELENEKHTKDTGETNIMKGFTNVSSSSLLSAFRETFLNIDRMIIEELAENFMTAF